MRRTVRMVLGGGLAAACVLLPAAPAGADLVDPPGACVATAAWAGGPNVVSTTANPDDVITVPRKATVNWTGKVTIPAGASRTVHGRVYIDLPPLFGGVTLGSWDGTATAAEKAGSYDYDLPKVIPSGVIFTVVGEHDENGRPHCDGEADVKIAGGVFDSPVIWGDLAGLLLLGGLLLLVGRQPEGGSGTGRMLLGALTGLAFSLFVAIALVLFGVIPLHSVVVDIVLLLGLLLGAGWGRWAPLGRNSPPVPM